jgi:choline dehydrogenase-like flavoprotein
MSKKYDVIVIGAGVAGALIAWKMAEAELSVLMLEAREMRLEDQDRAEFVKIFAELPNTQRTPSKPFTKAHSINNKFAFSPDGEDFYDPNTITADEKKKRYYQQEGPMIFKSQYQRLVGGSTWSWRGNSPRYVPSDFKLKSLFGHGRDWPLDYDDLEFWFCEAEEALGVAGDHDEWNGLFGANRSRRFPMEKIAQSYGDLQLIDRLKGATFDGTEIRIFGLPQARNSREYDGRPACHGNSTCIPICPIQAKYDATVHVKMALQLGAELKDKAVVTDLRLDNQGRISEVVYKTWDAKGESVTENSVHGKIVVLAANAIESPKILLMSNGGKGIANSSGHVGRNLMDHPGGEGTALLPFPVFPFRGPQSTSSIESFRDHKYRKEFCAFRLTIGNDGWGRSEHPFDLVNELLEKRLFGEKLREELFETVTHQLRLAYATDQPADPNNRVRLHPTEKDALGLPKPQIEYKVDDYVLKGAAFAQKVIKHIFEILGATKTHFTNLNDPARAYSGSAHIMGTCIMGDDPADSVVDADCRSHDVANLFIAGSSVFPTGAPTNPTLPVAALALRTAERIKMLF